MCFGGAVWRYVEKNRRYDPIDELTTMPTVYILEVPSECLLGCSTVSVWHQMKDITRNVSDTWSNCQPRVHYFPSVGNEERRPDAPAPDPSGLLDLMGFRDLHLLLIEGLFKTWQKGFDYEIDDLSQDVLIMLMSYQATVQSWGALAHLESASSTVHAKWTYDAMRIAIQYFWVSRQPL